MCGRFTLVRLAEFVDLFPWIRPPENLAPARYNIAPSQAVAVVPNEPEPRVHWFQWGLVPSWAKDPTIGSRMINARAESLASKPAFRDSLRRRRCLIPADGFYEWRKDPGRKTPIYLTLKSGKPLAFAGLWDVWHDPAGGELRSCTIVTVNANELVAPIHDRMPAIVPEEHYRLWLDPAERSSEDLAPALVSYPADRMQAMAVSRRVNSPELDSAECIEPADEGTLFG